MSWSIGGAGVIAFAVERERRALLWRRDDWSLIKLSGEMETCGVIASAATCYPWDSRLRQIACNTLFEE